MRVVALVPGGISDQILFFPTLDDIKRNYPDAEIDVVAEPRAKPAYRLSKSVGDVIAFDFKDRNSPADWANLLGVIRDCYYDVAIAVGQQWDKSLLLWLSGTPVRISYHDGKSWALTHPIPFKANQYKAHAYHDLLAGLDITTPCPELTVSVPKSDITWAEAEQKRLGLQGYIVIHTGSSPITKAKGIDTIYPVSHWQPILQDIQQRQPDLPIVVVQGPDDQATVAALTAVVPNLKITQPPDLGKLAALIAGANLVIASDSAPLQVAIALKVYTLALFGPTDPSQRLPQNDKFVAIQSPTGSMADLPPQQVLTKLWGG